MRVEVIHATPNPVDLVAVAAGVCYGKADANAARVERCMKALHMGVFEHVGVTFRIGGISRACSHQLVRHRMASYNQRSQRYCKEGDGYAFVMPASVDNLGFKPIFDMYCEDCLNLYRQMVAAGVPAEDARYILPQAGETEIYVTMNARELFHFLDLRDDAHAQWEIRDVARAMKAAAAAVDGQWAQLMGVYEAHR